MAQKVSIDILKKALLEVNPRVRKINFTAQTDLFEEGILDSYSVIQLVNTFEKRFGIVFDYADLKAAYFRNLISLIGILTMKYKLKEGKNPPPNKKKKKRKAKKAGVVKKAKKKN